MCLLGMPSSASGIRVLLFSWLREWEASPARHFCKEGVKDQCEFPLKQLVGFTREAIWAWDFLRGTFFPYRFTFSTRCVPFSSPVFWAPLPASTWKAMARHFPSLAPIFTLGFHSRPPAHIRSTFPLQVATQTFKGKGSLLLIKLATKMETVTHLCVSLTIYVSENFVLSFTRPPLCVITPWHVLSPVLSHQLPPPTPGRAPLPSAPVTIV